MSLEDAYATETQITAYVRNDGSENVTVDCAYVKGTRIDIDDVTIAPREVETILISGTYADGQSYEVKIVCKDGKVFAPN